jgi:predicted secreted protein with PEFG-CTERM motif
MIQYVTTIVALFLGATFTPFVFAEGDMDSKLEFAGTLEETLGHFWAIEQNLNDKNAELALVHATHPIAELYDIMKPQLEETDPALDTKIRTTLLQLKDKAVTTVSREQAQQAIDEAKNIIEIARQTVVGSDLSNDPSFKLQLIKGLLETSKGEYTEAVADGVIEEMAEFQDGSAFVWRSQQIFDEIKDDIDSHMAEEIEKFYTDLWGAYDRKADPSEIDTLAGGIIHEIDDILGVESVEDDLLGYVKTIEDLLQQTKQEYSQGNTDIALSLATKAYLDNFEFLEAPLVEMGEEELMKEVEVMLREELRNMIKDGASVSEVNSQIDAILGKMDAVAVVVPEFGTIAMLILVIAIISIISVTARTKLSLASKI